MGLRCQDVPVRSRLGLGARYERRPTGATLWPGIFPLAIALHPQPVRHGRRVLMRGCSNRFGASAKQRRKPCASTEWQWHENCSCLIFPFLLSNNRPPHAHCPSGGAAGANPVSGTRRASRVETCLAMQNNEEAMRNRRVWRAGGL